MAWNDNLDPNSVAYAIAADRSRFIRVLAGPGTGKSFALKRRVARLLEEGVIPQRVLPVTFTRVAAEDLHRELVNMGTQGCEQLRGSTLHSLGMFILGRANVLASTGRIARPLNQFELEPLLYDLTPAFGEKRARERRIKDYESAWARLQHEEPGFPRSADDQAFEKALTDWLRFHRGMLIGEIIPELFRYLRDNPVAPERAMYDHLLVDEYQDLNRAEQAVIDFLTGNGSLCVVGDDDQSVYSFKNAHPEGIREFGRSHVDTTDHQLLQCHRCPTRVVTIANALIKNNQDREARQLLALPDKGPGEIQIVQYQEVQDEASGVAAFVDDQINTHGRQPGEILVLAQSRVIGNPIHEALRARGIASKCYYQDSELDSDVAQERLAILKLLVDRGDRIALRWLLGLGQKDFRFKAYARIRQHCEQSGETPWDALVRLSSGELAIPYCGSLIDRFHALQNELAFLEEANEVRAFVDRWLRAEFTEAGELRLLVARLLPDIETVGALLSKIVEAVSQPEIPPDVAEVRVMSLHKSKGLSSPVVAIAGCVDGLLPREPKGPVSAAQRQAILEEQRRLFYVGLTRVRADPGSNKPGVLLITGSRVLTLADAMQGGISFARSRYGKAYVNLSRFIRELGPTAPAPEAA